MSDLVATEVEEIITNEKLTQVWIDRINWIVIRRRGGGKKLDWCVDRFGDCAHRPPLVAWKRLGEQLSCSPQWAHNNFDEWQPVSEREV